MGRRARILAGSIVVGLAAAAGALVLVLAGAIGGGAGHPKLSLAGLAAAVAPGASAVLIRAERAPAGAEGLQVTLPDVLIHPPAGTGSPRSDSTAASVYAGAGWRGALIAAVAALQVPRLTQFVTTDRAGAQAPGASFFLDGSVRISPGENLAGAMGMLGKVPAAATRRQLEDNLVTLRRGLPPGSIIRATVAEIPVDPDRHAMAYAVELRVNDLGRLRGRFGDLFAGLGTGLAPGPDSTVEGLAIHVVDRRGRNAGSWMATRAGEGTTVVDPRIHVAPVLVPRLHFVDETGGPRALPSAPAGPVRAPDVVPRVTGGDDILTAYARLHRLGLRMAIPQSFSLRSLCLPAARAQAPAPGTRVPPGAKVTVRRLNCAPGSPAGGGQATVVPAFTGRPASAAVGWAERHHLYWELDRLPPLRPSTRGGLLENYVVTGQRPAPGTLLGRGVPCPGYESRGCLRTTPLVMRARTARR